MSLSRPVIICSDTTSPFYLDFYVLADVFQLMLYWGQTLGEIFLNVFKHLLLFLYSRAQLGWMARLWVSISCQKVKWLNNCVLLQCPELWLPAIISIIELRMIMVIIVMKCLLVSWLLLHGGVKHAMDISNKIFQGKRQRYLFHLIQLLYHLHSPF